MRELIYLSASKLSQFQPDRRSWWRHVHELGLKGPPGTGEVKVAFPDDTTTGNADLATILKYLDMSSRAPKWYGQDGRRNSGDWVQFETRLLYGADAGVLTFWEPDLL